MLFSSKIVVLCKTWYFTVKLFSLGYSLVLFRMVIGVAAFQGIASPCGVPFKYLAL